MINHNFDELNMLFHAQEWLEENYGCEFYPSNGGFLNSSCPFEDHADSSPSFGINPDKGFFKCFGCGREGSFLTLVSQILNINFYQAVNIVAVYENVNLDTMNSLEAKQAKFKKAVFEIDNQENKIKRIQQKATLKIKKIMKEDFRKADDMYKLMDTYIATENFNAIKEIADGNVG